MVDTPAAFAKCAVVQKRSAAASLEHVEASVYRRCADRRFMVLKGRGNGTPVVCAA